MTTARQRGSSRRPAGPDRAAAGGALVPAPRPAPGRRRPWRTWAVVLPVDLVAAAAPAAWMPAYVKGVLALAVLTVALLAGGGRYRARLHLSLLDELPDLLTRMFVAATLVSVVFVVRHDGDALVGFLSVAAVSVGLVVAGRLVTTAALRVARERRLVARRTLLIGGGVLSRDLAAVLRRHPRYGLEVIGVVDDDAHPAAAAATLRLGGPAELDAVVDRHGIEVLLVADGAVDEDALLDRVRTPVCSGCDLLVVPRLHAFATHTGLTDHIGAVPVMRIRTPSLRGPAWAVKRALDVLAGAAALLLLAPLLTVIAAAVRWEGGPGVLFAQERVGRDGRPFTCLKFRSMRPADDTESATRWSVADDARIGPVGRLLRRTSLDELPQLWNILRGDMTLVGPRPERPHFVRRFSQEHPRYDHRHRVPSGLTGLAQVSGLRGADSPISDRARADNYYIENWSLWLDAKVLLRTVAEVLFARGR